MKIYFHRDETIEKFDKSIDENNRMTSSVTMKKNNLVDHSSLTNKIISRPRFRNFSHVSEFASGLELNTKSNKKKDKIDEFLNFLYRLQ